MGTSQARQLDTSKALVTAQPRASVARSRCSSRVTARSSSFNGRDAARGTKVVEEIRNAGGRARFVGADLEKAADVRRLATEAGAVDILVNNAGLALFGPTPELDIERFDALFASNVRAPFMLVAALAPAMVTKGRGSIINIEAWRARSASPAQPRTAGRRAPSMR